MALTVSRFCKLTRQCRETATYRLGVKNAMAEIPKRPETREYIDCVFQELLKRESFDALSVQSIAAACGLSRTTFYRCFQDKYDLLVWSYTRQIDGICGHVSSERDRLSRILDLMARNRQYFRKALKSDKRQILEDCIFQRSVSAIRERLLRAADSQYLSDELLTKIEFCCVGAQYIMKKWLLGEAKEAPDVIADRILDCFPEPVRGCCLMETAGDGTFIGRDG